MKIAIAGGTGAVGRHVVTAAQAAGHQPLVLSRSTGADLLTAVGLAERLDGVDAVIDVSGVAAASAKAAIRFFGTVTDNLIAAERAAGVPHHVALSIIGAVKANAGYYAGKAVQEQKVVNSGTGWSMLRASQFHEYVKQTVERETIVGIQIAPAMRFQPIAATEVADELVRIAEAAPSGLAPDLAGPREEDLPALVRRYLKAIRKRKPVLRIVLPGTLGRAMRGGDLLPGPGARLGTQTFDQWLAALVAAENQR
jgi:uncharacterized protein YbjT (DUF2867 family)